MRTWEREQRGEKVARSEMEKRKRQRNVRGSVKRKMEGVREKSKREKMRKGTTERDDFYSKCGVMAELIALSRG